jgi:hypothetical protein
MLTFEDCVALCGLSEDEILAIAEHERIPVIVASEMANYLVTLPDGEVRIKTIIKDDLSAARDRGDREHELALRCVLRNFILNHACCEERHRSLLRDPERRTS